ncbi:hypothetical protein GC176_00750 [bacterium]|nr:hypothetical protein [bacterium]
MDDLLSTVVTSALVATVANAILNAWLDSRKARHETRFNALAAAVTLEGYAITCAEKLCDHDLADSSDGHAGTHLASVPALPDLAVVTGFLRSDFLMFLVRPRKADIADRLLTFPQEVRQADQAVSFWWASSVILTLLEERLLKKQHASESQV